VKKTATESQAVGRLPGAEGDPTRMYTRLNPRLLGKLFLGLALGLALLALAARGIEPGQVWAGLLEADPIWVALAFLIVLLTTAAKMGRWRGLFPQGQRPGVSLLCRALLVGQLANALLPVRVGDVVRAYLTGEDGRASRATALGTIAAEKWFDVLFLLICAGIAALLAPLPSWLDASLVGLAMAGGCFFVLAVVLPEQRFLSWTGQLFRHLPGETGERMNDIVRRSLKGLAALREPQMAWGTFVWSLAIWTLAAATNYILFWAFDFYLPVGAALLLLVLLHVGVAPPSSPGRLGVFHALTVLGLATFGVDRSSGLAYATVLHLIVYLPQIVPGAITLGFGSKSPRKKP